MRPGSDGALALAMIHVLLEEALYDVAFVRAWTNGPFLVREDTQQLLTERDLTPAGDPETFLAWDSRRAAPVAYHPDRGYAQDGVDLALSGTYAFTLTKGTTVQCRPALALLKELAAQYAPEQSEAITWVPAADVRRAVRLFASDSVADRLVNELLRGGLLAQRRRVRIAVVLHNHHQRAALDRCEVDTLVESARRRRPIAHVHQTDAILLSQLE